MAARGRIGFSRSFRFRSLPGLVPGTIPFNMGNRQKHGLFEKNRGRELRKMEPDCKKPRKIGHSCMLKGVGPELIGIMGDPVASKKIIDWAKNGEQAHAEDHQAALPTDWTQKLPNDMGVSIPYGYPRAFTVNPTEEQLSLLYDLLEWTWGTREITFCDPMSGGGSIPFEALRYGLRVHANELNSVASVILKATLDYPARYGSSLVEDIRKYGRLWCERVRERLERFYPLANPDENIFCYLWARTVACPETGKPVPLSPNWWLRKGSDPSPCVSSPTRKRAGAV